jgi:hypothetical protein
MLNRALPDYLHENDAWPDFSAIGDRGLSLKENAAWPDSETGKEAWLDFLRQMGAWPKCSNKKVAWPDCFR